MAIDIKICNNPIIIDSWQRDDTYDGVYPSGARVKDAYFSPKEPLNNVIKSDWRYLFKLSREWCPWQFWCEIIAYRFGCVIDVEVPPVHIGLSKKYQKGSDTYAALIEWFYDEKKDSYAAGGLILGEEIENFDRLKGTQHNFKSIRNFFYNQNLSYWTKILTFDTLIGNTDRHQENWGIIFDNRLLTLSPEDITFSPAFDNGTALGYEITEENLDKYLLNKNKLEKYLWHKHAKHHMKWSLDENEQLNFYEFMLKFTTKFPEIKPVIAKHLSFSNQQVEEVLSPLVGAIGDQKYKLTQKRLDFIIKLIFERKRILQETLNL